MPNVRNRSNNSATPRPDYTPPDTFPEWTVKLMRRICALAEGRYTIVLSVGGITQDWTVSRMGDVETPGSEENLTS